jgi:hypothetical protein
VPRPAFLSVWWSESWKASYAALPADRQSSCDRVILTLIKGIDSAGLNVKPIQPEKYYLEARINSGDRIVFRVDQGTIYFIDLVKHDDIARYGRRPRQSR